VTKKGTSWFRMLYRMLFYFGIAWLLGFGFFFFQMPSPSDPSDKSFDTEAYVVLTGGGGRIDAGLSLLKTHPERKMLISGVNPIVEEAEIADLSGIEPALFDCCIDLDRLAKNTAGNAYLSEQWIRENKLKTITIVTADYHIQRSLILFKEAIPDKEIVAFSVKTEPPLGYLLREYHKYLFTVLRRSIGLKPDIRIEAMEPENTTI